ncbi:EAL domain-containing protein [Consotaella salsifontis]|uniref:PAS domain S-box-containing protein/diguanylate cyclase (GGDEF) domain-containing protein n=1 Tax=Consotaella salsifontis TaxID=1365950 RepID=A0A1T4MWS0_9HYPH|nr:EAL domain-containing protein [Consotaella salsifontis]SJZ71296.1 PAS domain S-box-containing protein/diguanylate cyclase (GGDEF) domain-containing protein [Consotaella salsifontis]
MIINCIALHRRPARRSAERPTDRIAAGLLALLPLVLLLVALSGPALALEPVSISKDVQVIDLKPAIELYRDRGRSIQVSTVPGADGIVRRIEVEAQAPNASGDWAVFALANDSDEQLDRLIVAPNFRLAGSGIIDPDLGSQRIASITPSEGFALDHQPSSEADVFLVTLNPGSVVTFVAELTSPRLPEIRLWQPDAYKDTVNAFTLYRGIVLGIAGLLAVFLTILFVVKGSAMFPATAALAWAVLAYICIDFDFWQKLVPMMPGEEGMWRAATEVSLALTLVLFLYAYLNLNRWHGLFSLFTAVWLAALVGLGVFAAFDPPLAAGLARLSLVGIAGLGLVLILYLSVLRFDRAIMLIPTWALIILWLFAAWMTVTGRLSNDIIQPALGGGLVLIVLLIGFTVMQHAFAGGTFAHGQLSDMERRSLALAGTGDAIWDWDVDRDHIFAGVDDDMTLPLPIATMNGPARDWLPILHPDDRDRFKLTLDTIVEQRRGRIAQEFRIRSVTGSYHWVSLRARPVLGTDGEVVRCVGTLNDITERKKAEERLLHDALHDQLTGLPNRELFLDRLEAISTLTAVRDDVKPTVFVIDIDRFKQVNDDFGLATGDTILLTIGRRLKRILKPQDTLARIAGDEFGLLLVSETDLDRIAALAENLREAIKAPIIFNNREIILTGSVGLTGWTERTRPEDALKEAELAMYQAKREGGDHIEPYRPALRTSGAGRLQLESDLRRAFTRGELSLAFQPIVRIEDGRIAGFEALLRWDHPKRGAISPAEFIPVAESSGQIVLLGQFALDEAARRLSDWHRMIDPTLFVSVNISSRQLIRQDLIGDVAAVLKRYDLSAGALKLELTESLVMDNPERSAQLLSKLKEMGLGLSLDDFGTGYSSLSYLMQFPFDTLKVDQSFLKSDNRPERPIILNSIVKMAHELNLTVVAEGVETEEDVERLRELDCKYAQSFLYSAPLTAEEARRELMEQKTTLRRSA